MIAKAVRGFKRVIVPDCPYCHKEHSHSADADGARTADCLQGEYLLDFSITFDEWCNSKQIKGNWYQALYHSLAAHFGGVDKIPNDIDVWVEEWNTLLDRITISLS